MDKTEYELNYSEITWSCTLSDGTTYKLKEDGLNKFVSFEDRLEYCEQVKKIRMNESDKQVNI